MSDPYVPAEWFEGSYDNDPTTEADGPDALPDGDDLGMTGVFLAVGAALVAGFLAVSGGD